MDEDSVAGEKRKGEAIENVEGAKKWREKGGKVMRSSEE